MLTDSSFASSTLALATTIHLALTVLGNHRQRAGGRGVSRLALISVLFAATPWLLPTANGVIGGLVAHAAWFAACDRFTRYRRAAVPRPAARPSSPPAPPPPAFVDLPVIATFDETADIKTIRFARPRDFAFQAGQFVTVRLRIDAKEYARCYSISSAPETSGYFEISVQRQGLVSNALHAAARPGATLSLRRPNGRFIYPADDARPIVLIAGGVGITPLISMLRHAVHAEPTRPITLVYSAQATASFAFRDELTGLAVRHPQVSIVFTATRDADPPPDVRAGRIDAALLRAVAPDLAHSVVCMCGPKSMIDAMTALLPSMGLAQGQIRQELFEAAVAASAVPATPAGAAAAVEFPLHCEASGTTIAIRAGETLLEAAERGGVAVASLCRAGVCGTCRTRVSSGDVDCSSTTLDDSDRAEGFVLACVATARGACSVEL